MPNLHRSSLARRWAGLALVLSLAGGLLTGCGAGTVPPTPQPTVLAPTAAPTNQPVAATTVEPSLTPTLSAEDARLMQRFRAAVVDAKDAEPSEIADNLTVINPSNTNLVWQHDTGRVLMATWTSWNGYDEQVGTTITTTREIWVTAVPDLQTFCQAYESKDVPLALRLEELMGLPPHNGKNRVVQFWVPTDGLFRPSPDPEITDSVAQLEMPAASAFPSQKDYEFSRDWFNLQRSLSYDEQNGYPWTRLGYTYDWGDPTSEIGLSEFVVWAGTSVTVDKVSATEEYCGK